MNNHLAHAAALTGFLSAFASTLAAQTPGVFLYEPFKYPLGDFVNAKQGIWSPADTFWQGAGTVRPQVGFADISIPNALRLANQTVTRAFTMPDIQDGSTVWIALTLARENSNYWGDSASLTFGNLTIRLDPGGGEREKSQVVRGGTWSGITGWYRGDGDRNPYLYVVKITEVNTGNEAFPSVATLYMLPHDITNVLQTLGAPYTEAMLQTHAAGTTSVAQTSPVSLSSGTLSLYGSGIGYVFDEFRVADSLTTLLSPIELPEIILPGDPKNVAAENTAEGNVLLAWDAADNVDA